jgi:hypothetical protein
MPAPSAPEQSLAWFESHPFGNPGPLAALAILTPHLRQIQPPSDGQTPTPRAHRQTHCHLTVILLADLTAVLPSSYGMLPWFGKTRIIHNPRHHRIVFLHAWKHIPSNLGQHLFIVPGRVRHQVMERLMRATNIVGSQARSHRLNTLALSGQYQSLAVVLQGSVPIGVPHGIGQALYICRESASAVGLARKGVTPRKQFYIKLFVFNTVILVLNSVNTFLY